MSSMDLPLISLSHFRDAEIILDCISDGVMTIDLEKRVTFLNRAMRTLLGFTGELPSQFFVCDVLVQSTICDTNDCVLERAIRGERVSHLETSIRRQDGQIIPVSINTDFLKDQDGQLIGLVEVIRDISSSRQLSAKLVEVSELKHRLADQVNFDNMVGECRGMREIFTKLPAIAASDTSTLITGESGTGKELIAYALHANSLRKSAPFVVIDCSTSEEQVLEDALFGHVKGAFLGAHADKIGQVERANHGTIFLDEVANISLTTQVKVLRILEKGEFERVGSGELQKVDVRIIGATKQDLSVAVKMGTFREDLFYRIRVLPIDLPPLRKRMEDLPLLVHHCIGKFNDKMNKAVQQLSAECLEALLLYEYPGNIRELQNIIEHAFVCCDGAVIRFDHLPIEIQRYSLLHGDGRSADNLKSLEREAIFQALSQTGWRCTEAAKKLGIGRSTLWRKMKQYEIDNKSKDVSL